MLVMMQCVVSSHSRERTQNENKLKNRLDILGDGGANAMSLVISLMVTLGEKGKEKNGICGRF
jgi:hypothetical protein